MRLLRRAGFRTEISWEMELHLNCLMPPVWMGPDPLPGGSTCQIFKGFPPLLFHISDIFYFFFIFFYFTSLRVFVLSLSFPSVSD